MLTIVLLGVVVAAGWGFGRARKEIDPAMTIMVVFAALTAHSGMQWAFLNGRMDQAVGVPGRGASQAVVLLIAAVEAVGLWLPTLLVPWARPAARGWAGLYAFAAAAIAAAYHYFPFDLVILSQEFVSTDGPPYLLAVFACLPFATAGFLAGWLQSANERSDVEEAGESLKW